VRVEGVADTGKVRVTLAFDDWPGEKVAPTTIELSIPAKSEAVKK
jgi:hypothetical protein